jgi:predicted AAA+ superfamily ATPase
MYFKRSIDEKLADWKFKASRKPLLLRGARQIGKTSAVRHFGKSFTYFLEINFDENPQLVSLFEGNLSIEELCSQLEIIVGIPIIEGETLLFLDEIQAAPNAIKMLRYFFEKKNNLHLVAAGSLLEFALADLPSFGVGRISNLFVYPFTFEEFLMAMKEELLLNAIQNARTTKPIPDLIHQKAIRLLKSFLIVGGLPEAVATFVKTQNYALVQDVLDQLIVTYQADFSKYKSRVPHIRIQEVFRNVIMQVGTKYSYSLHSDYKNYQVKEAIELLQMAGLVYAVTHSACNGIPLGAEINPKKRKILVFDTGVYQRLLGLDLTHLFLNDDLNFINKGTIAELFVGLELLKNNPDPLAGLYYWHREAKNSQAEVDYVIQQNQDIIPIEVKAGTKGAMQSMYLFMEEKNTPFGIRTSLENFGEIEKIKIIPIYAIGIAIQKKSKT